MNKFFISLFLILSLVNIKAQHVYDRIPIIRDTVFQWTAESDKVISFQASGTINLKTWYLDKLKNDTILIYSKKRGDPFVQSSNLSLPGLRKPEWLKGLIAEIPPNQYRQEWYFSDTTVQGYDRYKYRGGILTFNPDSSSNCDDANAFRAKQVLNYKNGRFSIWNVFISPLCARKTGAAPFEWYPLVNVAYNDNAGRKFPGAGKDVLLLGTNEIDYDFSFDGSNEYDTVLSPGTDIGSLIYQDVLKSNLKPVDIVTGKLIPIRNFLTRHMLADTVMSYDPDHRDKLIAYRVVQQERSSREFSRLRIKQEFYFDFKNERLYSVIKSVKLMLVARNPDNSIRGIYPYCLLE